MSVIAEVCCIYSLKFSHFIREKIPDAEIYQLYVDEKRCSGCKTCIALCSYNAISSDEDKKVSVINEALCKGCGTSAAACPSGAITSRHFTTEQIIAEIEEVLV